ncbi:hypothetical protein ICN86_09025 [Aquisalinus flavus]|uniref:hypothetical protein n=1 Tax=Aquisalinus flavus TaxID=1526572 RepID=UPI00165F1C84|nr:hypothetical protein [Aquisalinus flavus]MBD0426960.1 hypothetical protein [Aquisalinus flavus]
MTDSAFAELETAIGDGDENAATVFISRLLTGDLVDYLRSPETQSAIAEQVRAETNCSLLVAKVGVRIVAWAAISTLTLAGTKVADGAVRRIVGTMVGNPNGRNVYFGVLKILSGIDKTAAGNRKMQASIGRLDQEAAELFPYLPAEKRSAMAQMTALEALLSGQAETQAAIEALAETLTNPRPKIVSKELNLSESGRNRFYFGTRNVPMFQRENAYATLSDGFLNARQAFAWIVVHGPGGMGKSRLALELLRNTADWGGGFIDKDTLGRFDWDNWRPQQPELLVIDYPSARQEEVATMLKALALQADQGRLSAPVRLVFCERDYDGPWYKKAIQGGGNPAAEFEHQPGNGDGGLALQPLRDLWPVFEHLLEGKPLPDRSDTLARLAEIDPQGRPLFAAFYADALARGEPAYRWDRRELVERLLADEEQRYWWLGFIGTEADKKKYKRLAAIVTLAGGADARQLEALCRSSNVLPDWDLDTVPPRLALITGRDAGSGAAPMEPDLIGELFALETAAKDSDLDVVLNWPFRLDGYAALDAILRARRDYPDHPVFATGDFGLALDNAVTAYQSTLSLTPETISASFPSRELDEIKAECENSAALRHAYATILFNLIHYLGQSDMAKALALFEDLKSLAAGHPGEPAIREEQAKASFNLINDLGQSDMAKALALFEDLKALAAGHPGEPAIREEQATASFNLINDLGQSDMAKALALFEDLKALAAGHPGEPAIREWQAKASVNLIDDLSQSDMAKALALFEDLKALAAGHPGEPAIRELQARASFTLIYHLRQSDMAKALALFEDLKALAAGHPGEPAIREWQAKASFNLINDLGQSDMAKALALFEDLKALAAGHPGEEIVPEAYARAREIVGK